ncbi:MAG: restriction endonuclease subunit S [Hungatella sp.]|jgi:type I restriction enzyme S subunit|nr:restriction endonuclease subunit S [Hungatella sp.]
MVTYPNDWTEKAFNDFMKIKRGASPRPIENFITSSIDGVNWIKIGDAPRYGKNIVSTKEKITLHGAVHSVRVYPGDFLLSNSMSFGRPYILSIEGCIHDGWLRLYEFQSDANDEFLYYLLSSSYVQKQYEAFAAGSGVQNLNKEVVKKVTVFLPPIPEQENIAETLSNFDTYIDDLAELIEKKKGIRDGALEDLISRRTRVDGFSEPWEQVSFNQVITPKARIGWQGLKKHEYLRSGYSYLIGGTDFRNGTVKLNDISYVSKERYDMDANI